MNNIIGKFTYWILYTQGDYMWPFFKWSFLIITPTLYLLSFYSVIVVFPDYSLEMVNNLPSENGLIFNLWITSCFCIGRLHNTYWWSWVLPLIFGFFAAVIFAGLILEMTKAFIKGSIREWLP